jgi:hypothetical protein
MAVDACPVAWRYRHSLEVSIAKLDPLSVRPTKDPTLRNRHALRILRETRMFYGYSMAAADAPIFIG